MGDRVRVQLSEAARRMFASSHEWRHLVNAYGVKACCVDWSGGVFASCITRVQLYVNTCSWMAAVCAAAPLALANQLPLPRLYSALVRSSCKLRYIRIRPLHWVTRWRVLSVTSCSCGICGCNVQWFVYWFLCHSYSRTFQGPPSFSRTWGPEFAAFKFKASSPWKWWWSLKSPWIWVVGLGKCWLDNGRLLLWTFCHVTVNFCNIVVFSRDYLLKIAVDYFVCQDTESVAV